MKRTVLVLTVLAALLAGAALLVGAAPAASAAPPPVSFGWPTYYATGDSYGIVAGDFTGDGRMDILTDVNGPFGYSLLVGDGKGGFAAPVRTNLPSDPGANRMAAADFNRDNKLDAVMSLSDGHFAVLLGNGNGTFRAPNMLDASAPASDVLPCKLNGDDKLDLVGTCAASYEQIWSVPIFMGAGAGGFNPVSWLGTLRGPHSVTVADFDGDGDNDLVVGTWGTVNTSVFMGAVTIYRNNGSGAFAAGATVLEAVDPYALGTADFNGDKHPDLVVASSNTDPSNSHGIVQVLLGDGTGAFPTSMRRGPYDLQGASPMDVLLADFNRDGELDIAVANLNGYGDDLEILLGNGDGALTGPQGYAVDNLLVQGAVADFNADGKPDIAVSNPDLDGIRVLLNTTTVRDTTRPRTYAPSACRVKRGKKAALKYKVTDPDDAAVTVTIKIRNAKGKLMRAFVLKRSATGTLLTKRFTCTLARGTYRFSVYAKDAAGNLQSRVGSNTLTVK